MKRFALREAMNGIPEPPGKVWFWELEAAVVNAERCVGCGTCVAVCPSNSIGVAEETGLPELVKMCTGCSLCWDFCPRGGLRYEALWPPSTPPDAPPDAAGDSPLSTVSDVPRDAPPAAAAMEPPEAAPVPVTIRRDAADPYWRITGGPPGDGLGAVIERYAARAASRVEGAQDGGVVTAILRRLLEAGHIHGALVAKPSTDPAQPWKGVPTVATTAAELEAASGSFYNQTMALAELDLSAYDLPRDPRIAVVGTPCEIQGIRAMQSRRWSTGAHRVDAVVLTVALLCTKSFNYRALMGRELAARRGVDLQRVAKVDVIRGRMIVEYRDGEVAVDEPVKAFHGAALKGCDECADFVGRSADLSLGSVGSADGWTSVLVRTERGRQALQLARAALDVRELDDPEALVRLDRQDRRVAERSLARPFDPEAPLFISYEEHANGYAGTDRRPVVLRR